jgi:hypothetical protein
VGTSCATGCTNCPQDLVCPWDDVFANFDKSGVSTVCEATSCLNKSCVRDTPCQGACGGNNYCHLCPDRECTACSIYGTCDVSSCGSNATNDALVCKCSSTFGRPGVDYECKQCHSPCLTCDVGALTNYSDCLTCPATTYEVDIDTTHKFCLGYCPGGFTLGAAPICGTPAGAVMVFEKSLNTFVGPWTVNV